MQQPPLFCDTIADALRDVIRTAGGAKAVGALLWPSLPADQASSRVNDSLNPDRRQHFSEHELLHLLSIGRRHGCHTAMQFIARTTGYSDPQPVEPSDQLQALQREFIEQARALKALSARIETISSRANIHAA